MVTNGQCGAEDDKSLQTAQLALHFPCTLHIVHCSRVWCTQHAAHCILHTAHYTLYTSASLYCTLHKLQCTLFLGKITIHTYISFDYSCQCTLKDTNNNCKIWFYIYSVSELEYNVIQCVTLYSSSPCITFYTDGSSLQCAVVQNHRTLSQRPQVTLCNFRRRLGGEGGGGGGEGGEGGKHDICY